MEQGMEIPMKISKTLHFVNCTNVLFTTGFGSNTICWSYGAVSVTISSRIASTASRTNQNHLFPRRKIWHILNIKWKKRTYLFENRWYIREKYNALRRICVEQVLAWQLTWCRMRLVWWFHELRPLQIWVESLVGKTVQI